MNSVIIAYVPAIHQGYLELIGRHEQKDLFVVSEELIKSLDENLAQKLPRQLNAIRSTDAVFALRAIVDHLFYGEIKLFSSLDEIDEYDEIVMPMGDISNLIANKIPDKKIVWETQFLQYDWGSANSVKEVLSASEIVEDVLTIALMDEAEKFANQSSDWWRHVGAVLVKDGKILLGAYNQHLPNDETPYVFGDQRWSFNAGQSPEICGAIHGEKNVFALALLNGISTKGCDLYVTTFPCSPCAKFIAVCGISRLFFRNGYSNTDSEIILEEAGVEVIRVVQKRIPSQL